jgi:hypothetical protein
MRNSILLPILFVLSLSNTACTQTADNYSGNFANKELGLSVDVKKTGEKFSGFFEFQKQKYPFIGKNQGGILMAEYDFEGKKVPFSLSVNQGVYYLNSEGFNIEMQRTTPSGSNTVVKNDKTNKGNSNTYTSSSSGQRVNDPYGSYSFQIPKDWTSKEEQGSITITHATQKVVYNIVPHNFNEEEMLTGLEDVADESTNTNLRISAKENVANGVLVHFEGTSNGKAVIVKILSAISPYGGGVSFISSGLPENYTEKNTEILKAMAESVRFTKGKISSATQDWINTIKGRQLLYLHTSGGGSTRITLNLYENGQFDFANNSSYMSGGSSVLSYTGKESNSGTWKIQSRNNETVLVLFGGDRSATEYILTSRPENGEINLNDRRYFIRSLNQ